MNLRTLVLISGLLGLLLSIGGSVLSGKSMAMGIAITTLVMLVNLWGWSLVVGRAIGSAVKGERSGLALGFYGLKVGGLFASLWVLLSLFPVISVILGSSVVFGAVSVWAAHQVLISSRVGDA
jgi:hypothetical protein